jgi:energy-coupling factor transporter ATP-binding protein EcfA2
MVFKELEIQGFKSFPDKVKISFDTGVTGVVGPNGSGKSNLSDAVRWVLGETSSRQLRAAGKMEDVIFGGTRKRSPMGFAQVRLTLDNAAHTLDVDADEVTIGRKYYRSGDSEYTINGQVCRLRDVYELLLDTGIGRDIRSSGRDALRRLWQPKAASAARSLRKPAALPSTATARPKPSAVWPQRARTWSACGISLASWKAGWVRWKKKAPRRRSFWN